MGQIGLENKIVPYIPLKHNFSEKAWLAHSIDIWNILRNICNGKYQRDEAAHIKHNSALIFFENQN